MDNKTIEQNRDSLIESLITEENELLQKIKHSRDNKDFGTYKNLIRALADVTSLKQKELANIPRETWIEKSSHYYEGREIEKGDNEYIATWEQKGDEIRNHRTFKVEKEVPTIKIELSNDYIIEEDRLTIPMKIGKYNYEIHARKIDNKWVTESKSI